MNATLGTTPDPLDAALVVASDIHLMHMADSRARLLLDMLGRLSPSVEYLVLNGDIFDFCFGDSDYFRRKFKPLGVALSEVAKRGTKVMFVEGNHEFHLKEIGWADVTVVTERDFALTLNDGTRIKFMHGDLLASDGWYRAFRGLLKSEVVRASATLLPGGWLDAYSLRHAKMSRARDPYRKLDHQKILGAFNQWLCDGEFEHGIIGHFHVPYAEKRAAREGLMLSVESWDRPNLLVYEGGRFERLFLSEPGRPFLRQKVEPLFSAPTG